MRRWNRIKMFWSDLLHGNKVSKDLIVIRSDGGICSQIAFLALGKFYEDLNHCVKYDLSWFETHGKDMNGEFDRNFDLTKAFPDIDIQIASEAETYHYKRHFKPSSNDIDGQFPPVYLDAFYDNRWSLVIKYREFFKQAFKPDSLDLGSRNIEVLDEIYLQENACAIHVRRGDLGEYNKYYGEPLKADYYLEAIARVLTKFPNSCFYFFSDECDWVRENIISKVDSDVKYRVLDSNGSDKGYLDLYLMSKCSSFITSHGSLAKYARAFSADDAFIIEPQSKYLFKDELTSNVVVI